MKKSFLAVMIFAIALNAGAAARASESMTLEMMDGALLVVAEDDVADAVERRAESLKQEMDSAEKVRGILAGEFGSKVTLELFFKPTIGNMAGLKIERLTVREAILRGELPPIEGLEMKAAVAILEKCGFSVTEDSLFTGMQNGDAAREAFLTEGRLAALSGSRPMDIVEILTGSDE